ncbi:MAG: hypothetical protein Q9227_000905 [Pyrenula ochraceoflavens]
MNPSQEFMPLLGARVHSHHEASESRSIVDEEASEQYNSDEEATPRRSRVDELMTRFGSPAEATGLSGGGGVFGSSVMSRKTSMTFSDAGINRVLSRSSSLRRRSSIRSLESGSPSRPIRGTINPPNLPKKSSRRELAQESAPIREEDEGENEQIAQTEKPPKYKYGVSEGRFWAIFFTVLLVWLVCDRDLFDDVYSQFSGCMF